MIMDSRLQLCSAASVASAAGTYLLGSQIDTGLTVGTVDAPIYLHIVVSTTIVTGGSAGTIGFKLASDASAAVATDGTATDHITTEVYVTDDVPSIPAGRVLFHGELPRGHGVYPAYERYLGLLAIIGTTTITAGAINAYLTLDKGKWAALPDATN